MSLPAKALQVLIDIKTELLSRNAPKQIEETGSNAEVAEAVSEAPRKTKEEKPTIFIRHARIKSRAWQDYCRHGRQW